jgi:hypothetical protein
LHEAGALQFGNPGSKDASEQHAGVDNEKLINKKNDHRNYNSDFRACFQIQVASGLRQSLGDG